MEVWKYLWKYGSVYGSMEVCMCVHLHISIYTVSCVWVALLLDARVWCAWRRRDHDMKGGLAVVLLAATVMRATASAAGLNLTASVW